MPSPLSRRAFLSRSAAVGAGTAVAESGLARGESATAQQNSLESLVDDAADRALTNHDAGGVTVAVVDGDTVLTNGYGHAFRSEGVPVRADETLFRVGSVSKVATWTAAMQLLDGNRIEADASVDSYLDAVDIPRTYDRPITLEHLATHTPGFEVRSRGDSVRSPEYVRPLAESVSTDVPTRVRPPGELPQYTNYAAALAGQLVADVTGRRFGTYLAESVFEPLGMTESTFDPAPPELVPADDTSVEDVVSFYSDVAPASGLHTTGTDMARLLRAHLNGGVVDGERILSASAVAEMHRQWYTPHEEIDGMAFGLFEEFCGGTRLVRHGGSVPQFASEFALIPTEGVGLFVVAHGDDASEAKQEVVDAVLDRFAPVEPTGNALSPSGTPDRADELAGRYRSVNTTDNATSEKLVFGLLTSRPIDVQVTDDGRLLTHQGDSTDEWVEVEPLVFEHVQEDSTLLFRDDGGTVTHLLDGLSAYEKVAYHERLSVQGWLAAIATVTALTGLVGWPMARGWRRFRGGDSPPSSAIRARWMAGAGVAGLALFVVVLAGVVVATASMEGPTLFNRPPSWLWVVFLVPTAGAVVTVGAVGYAARAWYRSEWSLASRVHYSAVVGAAAVLYWLLHYWNLLAV
ncbi:CubicO group peptidase, beta-lactamase class C family [Halopelagius inordinatus]|uniref:CubicO group peptidase, beta-lactamase class C family n=1 Tax=Halopelagius inordinatus TaxID=553467 RepID=A0A1I2VLJ8_9EURY|nr:serine hydrolase domain-containing protein [Halopelagius inordinatus]SFG90010.1 CubicO group peptidase, beta-lactamase class C family [Halopelagius inordinatus]